MNKDSKMLAEAYEQVRNPITSTIFGDPDRPASTGIKGFLNKIIDNILHDDKTGAPRYNQETIRRELKKLNLTDEEIEAIRKKTIAAAKSAQQEIFNKYPEIQKNELIRVNAKNPDKFQIYDIWSLDNSYRPVIEFNKLFRDKLELLLNNKYE